VKIKRIQPSPRLRAAWDRRRRSLREAVDRGQSTLEWVIIMAACALLIAIVYAAVHSKILEKIGIINGS
jgi:hypothetical protein